MQGRVRQLTCAELGFPPGVWILQLPYTPPTPLWLPIRQSFQFFPVQEVGFVNMLASLQIQMALISIKIWKSVLKFETLISVAFLGTGGGHRAVTQA